MSHDKRKEQTGRGAVGKAIVAGVKDRKTGKVSARVVKGTDAATLGTAGEPASFLGEGLEWVGVGCEGMVGKEHQLGFSEVERSFVKKQTRREEFL